MKTRYWLLVVACCCAISFGGSLLLSGRLSDQGLLDLRREECREALGMPQKNRSLLHVEGQHRASDDSMRWTVTLDDTEDLGAAVFIEDLSTPLENGRTSILLAPGQGLATSATTAAGHGATLQFRNTVAFSVLSSEQRERRSRPVSFHYPVQGSSRIVQADGRTRLLGRATHHGGMVHAVDIVAEAGSPVLAGRAGRVMRTADVYPDHGCRIPALENRSNHVVILHDDGTEAVYGHLQQGSIDVERGQRVEAGQRIARVGNSGMSRVPHLHVHVGGLTPQGYLTLPLKFTGCGPAPFAPGLGRYDC